MKNGRPQLPELYSLIEQMDQTVTGSFEAAIGSLFTQDQELGEKCFDLENTINRYHMCVCEF